MGVRKTFGSDNHHSHYVVNSQFECTATALKKKKSDAGEWHAVPVCQERQFCPWSSLSCLSEFVTFRMSTKKPLLQPNTIVALRGCKICSCTLKQIWSAWAWLQEDNLHQWTCKCVYNQQSWLSSSFLLWGLLLLLLFPFNWFQLLVSRFW